MANSAFAKQIDNRNFLSGVGFKTRYGLVANPFAEGDVSSQGLGRLAINSNRYYRRVRVQNLM